MQKKTKITLAAGLAGILGLGTLAGVAVADGGWGGGHGMGGGHGKGRMAQQMMERYDANKDGKVSQEEIDTNRTQWHGEFDADKNATLSIAEFEKLWLKARFEQMVREFQRFDRDGNGQLTLEEYKGPLADLVAERDRNKDGFLSREDRPQRGEGHGWRHGKRGDRMQQDGSDGDGPPPLEDSDDAQ